MTALGLLACAAWFSEGQAFTMSSTNTCGAAVSLLGALTGIKMPAMSARGISVNIATILSKRFRNEMQQSNVAAQQWFLQLALQHVSIRPLRDNGPGFSLARQPCNQSPRVNRGVPA